MVVGNTLTVDAAGANPETVTITTVGTAGAGGTGHHVHACARLRARERRDRDAERRHQHVDGGAERHRAERDAGPTDATPAPSFGAPARIPIEADAGAITNTVDHFMPAIAADPASSGSSARPRALLLLLSARDCQYVNTPDAPVLAAGRLRLLDRRRRDVERSAVALARPAVARGSPAKHRTGNGNPDFGNVLAAAVVPAERTRSRPSGSSRSAIPVNGIDVSMYAPKRPDDRGWVMKRSRHAREESPSRLRLGAVARGARGRRDAARSCSARRPAAHRRRSR